MNETSDLLAVRNSFYCLVPSFGFKILANGDAVSCASAQPLGNLTQHTVEQIWKHPRLEHLRAKSRSKSRSCLCWTQPLALNWVVPQS